MELVKAYDKDGVPMIYIFQGKEYIGYIRFLIAQKDNEIYLYHILINEGYRNKGYATKAMDLFLKEFSRYNICLYVAETDCAKGFWRHYFNGKTVYHLSEKNYYLIAQTEIREFPKYEDTVMINFCCDYY